MRRTASIPAEDAQLPAAADAGPVQGQGPEPGSGSGPAPDPGPDPGPMPRGRGTAPELSVAILLWPSFPLMSLAGIVESLRHAGDYGDQSQQRFARWDILGGRAGRTLSSCGIPVEATADYIHPGAFDYVFAIGGLLKDMDKVSDRHRAYLHEARRAGCTVIGVCTGCFALARERLLDGRTACVHPYHRADFEAAFPRVKVVPDQDFDIGEGIGTVPGGISILPLMSRIIGRHFGPQGSAKTVHQLAMPASRSVGALDVLGLAQNLQISDPRIQRALVVLESQSARNPSIRDLARSLGLSERHFLRLFQAQVGTSPKDYLVDLKLRAAVWMLRNTRRSVTSIAYSSGFSSGASLADHCRRRLGQSPTALRRAG